MLKLNTQNKDLEKKIVDFKNYIKFLENNNKIFGAEIASIKSESLIRDKCESLIRDKCESCEFLKKEITNLHEILEKITNDEDKFNLIISNKFFF